MVQLSKDNMERDKKSDEIKDVCTHPKYTIVVVERRGFMVQLFCSKCKKPLPFDLCDKKEWDKKSKRREKK